MASSRSLVGLLVVVCVLLCEQVSASQALSAKPPLVRQAAMKGLFAGLDKATVDSLRRAPSSSNIKEAPKPVLAAAAAAASSSPHPPVSPASSSASAASSSGSKPDYCGAVEALVEGRDDAWAAPSGSHGRVIAVDFHGKKTAVKQITKVPEYEAEVKAMAHLPPPPAGINIVLNDRSDAKAQGFCPRLHLIVLDKFLSGGQVMLDSETVNPALKSSLPAKLSAVRDMARAIQWLASHGVIHADIRGDNAMLDEKGHAYLIDMGNAGGIGQPYPALNKDAPRGANGKRLRTMRMVDHYNCFFSPPSLCGHGNDDQAVKMQVADDVFRLGVTLVHLLIGMTPCGNHALSGYCGVLRADKDWGRVEDWVEDARERFEAVEVGDPAVKQLALGMLRTAEDKRLTIAQVIEALDRLLSPRPAAAKAKKF